jgi:hypothetical protein
VRPAGEGIFDTDMESDVDDVGALAMLQGISNMGDTEILATMVCSLNPWAVPVTDVVNTFCGRPDVPIGAVKTWGVYRGSSSKRTIRKIWNRYESTYKKLTLQG